MFDPEVAVIINLGNTWYVESVFHGLTKEDPEVIRCAKEVRGVIVKVTDHGLIACDKGNRFIKGAVRIGFNLEKVKVINVIDGDTFFARDAQGRKTRIRMIGINAPERGEKFFYEAQNYAHELIGGRQVLLEREVTNRDRYGRYLRHVFFEQDDGEILHVNLKIVREGLATNYPFLPDLGYMPRFRDAQRRARKDGKGFWACFKQKHPSSVVTRKRDFYQLKK